MSKYIIDIPNGVEWGVVTCRTEDGFYTRDFDSLEELNSDYINEHFGDLQETAYKKGLEDGKKATWEAVRKVIHLPEAVVLDLFTDCYSSVCTVLQVFLKYEGSEVIEKLKAYEEKQKADDKIEVGDEVDAYGNKGVVTYMYEKEDVYCVMMRDGSASIRKNGDIVKTGRHFDIASILEAMKK